VIEKSFDFRIPNEITVSLSCRVAYCIFGTPVSKIYLLVVYFSARNDSSHYFVNKVLVDIKLLLCILMYVTSVINLL